MLRFLIKKDADRLKAEYRLRFAVVASGLACLALLIWIVSLFPTYILVRSENKVVLEEIKTLENTDVSEDSEKINERFDLVRQITIILKDDSNKVTSQIKDIVDSQNSDVSINSILFSSENSSITINGLANNRDALKNFGESLKEKSFSSVDVPFSNFADSIDIPYTITINI